jgi:hypothetical protein
VRKRLAATITASLVVTMVQTSAIASPVVTQSHPRGLADLGQCENPGQPAHQGGDEFALVPSTTGVVSRVYTKTPDLCNIGPVGFYNIGSASWVMLTNNNLGFDYRYQVGTIREDGDPCLYFYMEYKAGQGTDVQRFSRPNCASSITWYRYDLHKISGVWSARVFLDSTNQVMWTSPYVPTIAWQPENAHYFSEVQNAKKDQSGGSNISRLTFDAARWYTSTGTVVLADMQGTERICQFCGTDPPLWSMPYNTQWYDGNTFEVWTDGF